MKATQFRPNRTVYEDSMRECVSVSTPQELAKAMLKEHPRARNVKVEHQGTDERNGWDTWVIIASGKIVGFTDGDAPELNWKVTADSKPILTRDERKAAVDRIKAELHVDHAMATLIFAKFMDRLQAIKPDEPILDFKDRLFTA